MRYKESKKRTIEALRGSSSDIEQTEGRIHEPLIHIPLQNVVPDELHLLLRVTDVLTRNLINGAMAYDQQNSSRIRDILKRPMITNLLKAIRSCGVSFNIFIKKEGFDFTSLVGDDKKTLLNKLPDKLCTCQPLNYYAVVQQIWKVWISNSYGSYHCLCTYRILRLCMTQLRQNTLPAMQRESTVW